MRGGASLAPGEGIVVADGEAGQEPAALAKDEAMFGHALRSAAGLMFEVEAKGDDGGIVAVALVTRQAFKVVQLPGELALATPLLEEVRGQGPLQRLVAICIVRLAEGFQLWPMLKQGVIGIHQANQEAGIAPFNPFGKV